MISRLFQRRPAESTSSRIPPGERIYAIGDVHGRLDLMEDLLARIDADSQARGPARQRIIFLGDLIDRGPHSAQVIEAALKLSRARPDFHFLMGNHEEVFLHALSGDRKALAFFTRIGGKETILSYGISPRQFDDSDYDELAEMLEARVPAEHLDFINSFEDMIFAGDYVFVHAGVRPGTPLDKQRQSDLRWIRSEFIDHRGKFEKIVVHGHTISEDVDATRNRIGLDTGAYDSGKLSAMGFEEDRRWILQALD